MHRAQIRRRTQPGVVLLGLLAAGAMPFTAAAQAAAADASHGEILYRKHCVSCHGPRGWGDGPREIPAIAGLQAWYVGEQLAQLASGRRPGSAMHGPAMYDTLQAADLGHAKAMDELAAYLGGLPANPRPEHGAKSFSPRAAVLYTDHCAGCHGVGAAGGDSVPKIGGQHYSYLLTQLRGFSARHAQSPDKGGAAGVLGAAEAEDLADYISWLPTTPAPAAPRSR